MKITGLADLARLEENPFDAVFPHRTPWDILQASAQAHGDKVAIRYLNDAADPARQAVGDKIVEERFGAGARHLALGKRGHVEQARVARRVQHLLANGLEPARAPE